MTPPNPELIDVLTRFGIASQLYQTAMDRQLSARGLTLSQLSVLSHIVRRQTPQRITDIARAVEVGQPAVSKMLSKFEGEGWVTLTSNSTDKRSKSAQATEKGAAHLMQVQFGLLPGIAEALGQWPKDELAGFSAALSRFADYFEQNRRTSGTD